MERALNALEDLPDSQNLKELCIYTQAVSPEPTQSKALEKSHKKRRKKTKTKQNEDLVIKLLCGYGIEYEIDAALYKDFSMFKDKRSLIIKGIKDLIKENHGIKLSLYLTATLFNSGNDAYEFPHSQPPEEQRAVLDLSNIEKLYDEQVAYLHTWFDFATTRGINSYLTPLRDSVIFHRLDRQREPYF